MSLRKITSVMLNVTHSCNLRCRYCFVHLTPQTMTYQVAKDSVDFLLKNCENGEIPSINFFGGEPTLCWDSIIAPLTEYIRKELVVPFHLGITTNGTLLDKDRILFLKNNNIGILFSIDGAQQTLDYNRPCADGSGSFDELKDLIPLIASTFLTTFRMTVIPETCEHIFENITFARESGFPSFFLALNDFQEWSQDAWDIVRKEMRKYSNYYIETYNKFEEPIRFLEFEKMFGRILRINNAVIKNKFRVGCNACNKCGLGAKHYASISPNGDIYACLELSSNANRDNVFWIGDIYNGIDDNRRQALMNLYDSVTVQGSHCSDCKLNRVCDGGCVANNYMINGSVTIPTQVFCTWRPILLDEAIYVARALGENDSFIAHWRGV